MAEGPRLLIAAGGTGGHMFPAQALAEVMLAQGWQVHLSTDERGARYAQGFPGAVAIEVVRSATFARGGIVEKLATPFRIAGGILTALRRMRAVRPDVVVGFGGYPSIPALTAAVLLGVARGIHEQNGVLGRVNRLFAAHVDFIACGTWPTPLPAGLIGHHTGNPVRAAVIERASAPYIPPGDYPVNLLVFGGSQGSRLVSDAVVGAVSLLPERARRTLRLSHQARDEDQARVQATYAAAGVSAEVAPFFADLPRRLAEAQLVICRSGASSVADLSVIGRPSILIPYAAATADHQTANAQALVAAGGAILIPESRLDARTLAAQIASVLGQPEAAVKMAHAALSQGIPDATTRLAALVTALAEADKRKTRP